MKVWRFGHPIEWLDQRYRLDGILGSGGMADVCLAWDTREEREVAIKLIKADELDQPTLDRFLQEASHLAGLDHPNILRLYSELKLELLPTMPGVMVPYLVMEYARGGDLYKRLQSEKPFPMEDTLLIFFQLCRAVSYAHERGVIHRDLKPSNILFRQLPDGAEQVVLSDFGLAVKMDASQQSFKYGGTLSYMAPEQMKGQAVPASDIFSLGVILYRLCTGRLPFERSVTTLQDHDVYRLPSPPSKYAPDLPPGLDRVILRALAADPQQRFSRALDFWEAVSESIPEPLRLNEHQRRGQVSAEKPQIEPVNSRKGPGHGRKRISEVKPGRVEVAPEYGSEMRNRVHAEQEEAALMELSPADRTLSVRIYLDSAKTAPSPGEPAHSLSTVQADKMQEGKIAVEDPVMSPWPKHAMQEEKESISDEFDLSLMHLPAQLIGEEHPGAVQEEQKSGEDVRSEEVEEELQSQKRVFPALAWQHSSKLEETTEIETHDLAQTVKILEPIGVSSAPVVDGPSRMQGSQAWKHTIAEKHGALLPFGKRSKVLLGLSVVLVCALLLGGIFAAREGNSPLAAEAEATVNIAPVSKVVTDHYAVTLVQGKADPMKQQVTAQPVSSGQQTMTTVVNGTGQAQTGGAQGRGDLTFTNIGPKSQPVAAGTVFTGADGVQVVLNLDIVIPPGLPPDQGSPSEAFVSAHAANAGAAGNIPVNDINQKCCSKDGTVTVSNGLAFTGGKDGTTYHYVQQQDVTAAVASLKQATTNKADTVLSQQVPSGEVLAQGAQCTSTMQTDQPIGDRGKDIPSVTATVSAVCTGMMYDLRPLQARTKQRLQDKAEQELGPGYTLQGDVSFKSLGQQSGSHQQTVIQVAAEGRYVSHIDEGRKLSLAKLIAGKRPTEARTLLEQQGDIKVISLPQKSLPTDAKLIRIQVQTTPASTS